MRDYLLAVAGSDIDYFYRTETFLKPGDACIATPLGSKVGGCVLNVGAVAQAAGLDTVVLDYLKQDDEGTDLLISTLKEKNIDVSHVCYGKDVVNGNCLIMQSGGEKCIYVIDPQRPYFEIDESMRKLLNEAQYIYSLARILKTSFASLEPLREARRQGAKLIFDGSCQYRDEYEKEMIMELADGLFLNEKAYARLCEVTGRDAKDRLLARGCEFICVTAGEKGATCHTADGDFFQPALKVDAVDSTGAGDSFAGCFMACRHQGMSHQQALYYAAIAGAYCCTREGGMAGSVSLEVLREFAREQGFN
ncbi:MAG: carbohydrate kinase family protein [Erysipelotrichaceae bacterium]|nr:carbohydrate kinase family protein [Erysipelotrichaceae bacterium]